jgi:hypothetical protein
MAKGVRGMAQVVENLPSKCEALSSNYIPSKKRVEKGNIKQELW